MKVEKIAKLVTETKTERICINCRDYKSCSPILKKLGCDPKDPNNPAITLCSVFRPN